MAKYGDEVFTIESVASCLTAAEASQVERDVIERIAPHYNQTNGGEITVGRKFTPECVAKRAAKNRGRKCTEEQKAANSAQAKKRHVQDPQYRAAILASLEKARLAVDREKQKKAAGESARNRVWTSEMLAELSASCMGRRYGPEIIDRMRRTKYKSVECIETQTIYPSMLAAAAATGVSVTSVSRVCLGERNSVNGLTFRRVNVGGNDEKSL
jgi:hypothetical protein